MSTCAWQAVQSDVCQTAAANFINKYKLSISVAELDALVGEGKFCGCEGTYNCKANKLLFFAREDVKEIIDNNLLYDSNNANLSSFDILQSYTNSQCDENIASMTYDDLMDDIGASGDFILEDIYFKDCKNLYCVYNDIKNLPNNYYSKLIKDLHEDKTLLIEMSVGTHGESGTVQIIGDNYIRMSINQHDCINTDFIGIAQTLLHELKHIDFKTTLISGWSNNDEYRAMWRAWVNKKYGIEYYNEHHIMVLEYMKLEANTLRLIDGNQFPYDHYLYIVWKGGLEIDWQGAFSESTVDDWKEKNEKIQSNPNKYKCN